MQLMCIAFLKVQIIFGFLRLGSAAIKGPVTASLSASQPASQPRSYRDTISPCALTQEGPKTGMAHEGSSPGELWHGRHPHLRTCCSMLECETDAPEG